ncbi:hypothetical protein ACFVS9_09115 [Streptomyces sp. NPDC058008]|uniref:hypothetical protein n=1 Tax=Streptomyces sp. NPDC058008 TaxID=3346303 RepID=UPI0036E7704E
MSTGNGTPLLPDVLRAYPYAWDNGFVRPSEKEDGEALAHARAVLTTCLPPDGLAEPEPPREAVVFECSGDACPEWTAIRSVLRARMPYARHVTVERMAAAGGSTRPVSRRSGPAASPSGRQSRPCTGAAPWSTTRRH